MFLQSYGLSTAAGPRSVDLWHALISGRDCSKTIENAKACYWPALAEQSSHWGATAERMVPQIKLAIDDLQKTLSQQVAAELPRQKIAVIFASTKGCVDDYVWQKDRDANFDPFEKLVDETKKILAGELGISIERSLVMSTACTSTLSAVAWAEKMLAQEIDFVFVVAADAVGPFVHKGFSALKALTKEKHVPFSAQRSGLQLGEAAGILLLSRQMHAAADSTKLPFEISSIALDTEGNAVTRPTSNGKSLACALKNLNLTRPPDVIIAHGTGTQLNDPAEDASFESYFSSNFPRIEKSARPPITATKWCIGHALGASAIVDIVASCEALKHQKLFRIANTEDIDETFSGNYLSSHAKNSSPGPFENVVISSVGFGGMHAAACIKKLSVPFASSKKVTSAATHSLKFHSWSEEISFPLAEVPTWSARVDRWSQLDAAAQSLCEAYVRKIAFFSSQSAPIAQFLASDEGSNESDLDFAASNGLSPAKFVHTLPNIRCSPLLQLMEWHGPVFCFQDTDPLTIALAEQSRALKWGALNGPLWTWSVKSLVRGQKYRVTWCAFV